MEIKILKIFKLEEVISAQCVKIKKRTLYNKPCIHSSKQQRPQVLSLVEIVTSHCKGVKKQQEEGKKKAISKNMKPVRN